MQLLAMVVFLFVSLNNPVFADSHQIKKRFGEYFKDYPWLGLVADHVTLGPIKISKVNIHGDKITFAKPGEALCGSLRYKINSKDLSALHLYHLIIGVKGEGAQNCVTHTLGICDSKGRGHFDLKAPDKPGVYEVRLLLHEGSTCNSAYEAWNADKGIPSAAATIGVIIVE